MAHTITVEKAGFESALV